VVGRTVQALFLDFHIANLDVQLHHGRHRKGECHGYLKESSTLTIKGQKLPAVPKFSSFQPRKPAPSNPPSNKPDGKAQPPSASSSRYSEIQESTRRKHSKHKGWKRTHPSPLHHDAERAGRDFEHRVAHSALSVTLSSSRAVEPAEDSLYISDRRGDADNLHYGSISRYHVPSYNRRGYGGVVGVEPGIRIDRDLSTHSHLVLNSRRPRDQARTRELLKRRDLDARASETVVPVRTAESALDLGAEFIAVGKKRRRRNPARRSHSADEDASDSNQEPVSSSEEDSVEPITDPAKERNVELTRLCKSDPTNLTVWLQMISHQDAMIRLDRPYASKLSASEKRALADVKASIYNDAIPHFKGNEQALEVLWLGLVQQGDQIWSFDEIIRMWNRAIKQNRNSLKIRTGRLDFLQRNYHAFRYG
jgi:hypothetical protein